MHSVFHSQPQPFCAAAAIHAVANSPLAAQLDPAGPLAAFLERTRSARTPPAGGSTHPLGAAQAPAPAPALTPRRRFILMERGFILMKRGTGAGSGLAPEARGAALEADEALRAVHAAQAALGQTGPAPSARPGPPPGPLPPSPSRSRSRWLARQTSWFG